MNKYLLLDRVFGYQAFRPGQEDLIDGVLSGRDVLGIMPTGGGKSMCYQLPGLMLPGLTIVVSPLISLMHDQVQALKAAGIPAAYINSNLSAAQIREVYRNLYGGRYKILYLAPERLDCEGFSKLAETVPISFLAVDEAHCISQWGQDFRPSYLRIVQFIESLAVRPVVGAYTATATQQVREDICRILKLKNPVRRVTGFDRPNLFFDVRMPEGKDAQLLQLLAERKHRSGIVYCSTRKNVETVCQLLQDHGYKATRYHAGLDEKERSANQEDFLYDRKTVMVATNAFGMGIDKSNVSYVIHYNMPKSLEAYYQEAGRAGRDGSEADCILLFSRRDVATARYLINNGSGNEELDEVQQAQVRIQDLARLDAMERYCKSDSCLRGTILEYFGQKHTGICGNCGTCLGSWDRADITREAQMLLSCVKRIYDRTGSWGDIAALSRTLRGSRDKMILDLGLNELSTYGIMQDKTRTQIYELADHLEAEGYLHTDPETKGVSLTAGAAQVLYRGKQVFMLVPKAEQKAEKKEAPAASIAPKLSGADADLFDVLKELRSSLAKESGVPPFVIFSNATLTDMVKKKPTTRTAFKKVSGVGEIKAAWYGDAFVDCIRNYLQEKT